MTGGKKSQKLLKLNEFAQLWRAAFLRRVAKYCGRDDMGGLVAGLGGYRLTLNNLSSDLECRFLECSRAVESLADSGGNFFSDVENLVEVATGRKGSGDVFDKAVNSIDQPLNFLIKSHDQCKEMLVLLDNCNASIIELLRAEEEIQRTMAPLKHIQTLFRIESAPLGLEVQSVFSSLTLEFEQLQKQVSELFTTKFSELRVIRQTIEKATHSLQQQSDKIWSLVSMEKNHIDSALKRLEQELSDNQQREINVLKVSSKVSGDIQKVVMALQFQDIINQKLQHINWALEEVIHWRDKEPKTLGYLQKACAVLAEQVGSIEAELAEAESTIQHCGADVLASLEAAGSQCVSLEEFNLLTTSTDGMVQILLEVITTLRKQINLTVELTEMMAESLRPFNSLASGLTGVVHEMSHRIHLIGLNAQIQAAGVENGIGLEVLSARTSDVSTATGAVSEKVAKQLDDLVRNLSQISKNLDGLRQEALQQQQQLDDAGAKAEVELHALRDSALSSLQKITECFELIRGKKEKIDGTLGFAANHAKPLQALQAKLLRISQCAAEGCSPEESAQPVILEGWKQHYTMASERRVHDQALAVGAVVDVAVKQAVPDSDGIELFAPLDTQPQAPVSAPLEDKQILIVAQLVKVAEADLSPVVKDTNVAEYGTNVELF